jgi:hypothetical protein
MPQEGVLVDAKRRPRKGADAVRPDQRLECPNGTTASLAEREVRERIHAVAVVSDALNNGAWEAEVEILDQLARIVADAARWQLTVELEAAA